MKAIRTGVGLLGILLVLAAAVLAVAILLQGLAATPGGRGHGDQNFYWSWVLGFTGITLLPIVVAGLGAFLFFKSDPS